MGFILNRNSPPDYLITMGQGKQALQPVIEPEAPKLEKPKRRLKVEKRPDADVETIHKEDPGKQGPIGGRDAQEPPPREDLGQDVNIGHGEEENGEE